MVDYKDVEEFSGFKRKNKAKILKYIELCFDQGSPLNKIENFRTRQVKACKKARLNPENEDILEIINFNDEEVNILINAYLGKVKNNNLYDSLISNQFLFWTIQEEIRKPLDDKGVKHKADLSKFGEEVEKRISDLMGRIYGKKEVQEVAAKIVRLSYDQRVEEKVNV